MKQHGGLFGVSLALVVVLLSAFLVARAVGVTVLEDPRPTLAAGGTTAALLGVALLVADAVLPVPSSLVMISLGALYGPFLGAALSLVGRFGMSVTGLALGRAGAPVLLKLIGRRRAAHAEDLVDRWGALAIVFSRPVPLLAETVVLTAGAARLPWRPAIAAAFVGALPEAVVYGLVGTAAAANGVLVWVGFLVVGLLFRGFELVHRRRSQTASAIAPSRTSPAGT